MSERATVLLVDDDPRVLRGLRRLLEGRFRLLEADDGDAALGILDREDVAVIVSDVAMPGMDGLRLLERAAEISPHTVRMLLTGHGDFEIATRAVNEARASAFFSKPCDPARLEAALERAIEERAERLRGRRALDQVDRLRRSLREIARSVEEVGIRIETGPEPIAALPEVASLSQREWEVARLLLRGDRVSTIARALSISTHTVRSHLRRMFQKLEVRSQEELIARLRGR